MHDRLPLDVISLILASMPDLFTLKTAIHVNKRVYSVFLQHPSTIRTSVGYNEVGSALPQACYLAMLLQRRGDDFQDLQPSEFADLLADFPEEDQIDVSATLASPALTRMITGNAKSLFVIECYYANRYHDLTASLTTPSLTSSQSLRFTRALYRVWSYLSLFYDRWIIEADWEDDEESALPEREARMALLRDQQRAFLLKLRMRDEEKQQFCALISFLDSDLLEWVAKSVPKFYDPVLPVECDISKIAAYLAYRHQLIVQEPSFNSLSSDVSDIAHTEVFKNVHTL